MAAKLGDDAVGAGILPHHIEPYRQIVGPEQWQQKKKSKGARIIRCRFKADPISVITKGVRDHVKASMQQLDIIVKYLEKDEHDTAAREIANLKLLGDYPHMILYLDHFVNPQGMGIVLSPSACCDLSDFMADMSKTLANTTTESRVPFWDIPSTHQQFNLLQIHSGPRDTAFHEPDYQWPFKIGLACQMQLLSSFFPCLCHALDWVHKAGLCHKDIKPENLLILQGGTILLADFGSAQSFQKLLSSSPPATVRELKGFAKKYAAPEVYQLVECHTAQSDIFSLGTVFSEMLTLLAARTLDAYEMFRLREFYGKPYWKQPVYSRTITLVQQWLAASGTISSYTGHHNAIVWGAFRTASKITTSMVDEKPVERPTASKLVDVWFFNTEFKCIECLSLKD